MFERGLFLKAVIIAALVVTLIVASRWVRLFVFRARLSAGPALRREEFPDVLEKVSFSRIGWGQASAIGNGDG